MALADEFDAFAQENRIQHGPPCTVCQLPDDLRALVEAKRELGKPYTLLSQFLAVKGHRIRPGTLSRHVREAHGPR